MKSNLLSITQVTFAVFNMEAMLQFYSEIFGLQFTAKDMGVFTLHCSEWNGCEIQFCPAAIAQNTSSQNRHQFTVQVASLDETLAKVLANGGKQMGEKIIDGDREQMGIMDPDQNSMVLMTII